MSAPDVAAPEVGFRPGAGSRIRLHAQLVGQRIDTRPLEGRELIGHTPFTMAAGSAGVAFLFRFGVLVSVGLDADEQSALLAELAPHIGAPLDEPEHEDAELRVDPEGRERIDAEGGVHIREASLERLQVVAEILAKSTVLAYYEERVARVFDEVERLARDLGEGRQQPATRKRLLAQIGEVLRIQTQTVGRVEVTEKPDLAWEQPELDRLYERLAIEYELRDRDLALTRKLDVIARTAETCHDLLQHRQTLRVEWYIVILILVEIVIIVWDILR